MTTYRHLSAGNDSMGVQNSVSTSCAKEDENESTCLIRITSSKMAEKINKQLLKLKANKKIK